MESKIGNLESNKSKIISYIKINGPTIPIKISTYLGVDTMLASAFLADLLSDNEIKISKMKIGNSPIYFLVGQEEKLQDFSKYLSGKEREAFELLKDKKILRDRSLEPAIRVALRSIKDFAFYFNIGGELFWRYYLINREEASEKVERHISKQKIPAAEKIEQVFSVKENKEDIKLGVKRDVIKKEEQVIENIDSLDEVEKKKQQSSFIDNIEEYLNELKFQIVRKIQERKRDYSAIVRIRNDSEIKDYFCIAKDKKTITETDIFKFLDSGKKNKLPILVVSTGNLSKNALEWVDYLGNKVNFKLLR